MPFDDTRDLHENSGLVISHRDMSDLTCRVSECIELSILAPVRL